MAKDSKGGRRLSGGHTASYTDTSSHDFSLDDTIAFAGGESSSRSSVDDAVVDEILRSISEQSSTPVPNTPTHSARQSAAGTSAAQQRPTFASQHTGENSYAAAARAHHAEESQATVEMQGNQTAQRTTGPVPDPAYYAMRDPAQTQSFQPARPAHRDTDRLPTLVEEKPIRRKSALGKVLTFFVIILVIVALALGIRMAYILGPSMGWNLPDLSQLPIISTLADMLPDEEDTEETVSDDTTEEEAEDETDAATPTSITLDQETLELSEGDVAILTASVDTDWEGTIVWATSDESVATVTSIGDMIAQVEYVGEGSCSIAAVVPAGVQQEGPSTYCRVTCAAAAEVEDTEEAESTADTEETNETTAEHIDIELNREDFTLNVGESHQLMDENADQVTWTSSNTAVATVSESGVVTAVSSGTATITATGPDGTTASAIARIR